MSMDRESQDRREQLILLGYSLYTALMVAITLLCRWDGWLLAVFLGGQAVCCWQYLKKVRTYQFRAWLMAIVWWLTFSPYLYCTAEFTASFPVVVCVAVLLTSYCIPELTYVSAVFFVGHVAVHILVLRDLDPPLTRAGFQDLLSVLAILVALYVTWRMTRAQMLAFRRMLENMEAAQTAERTKDDFLANVSHEIRTPINTVCGISEIVLREELPDQVRASVRDIQTAGRRLLAAVSDILDFTELQSGSVKLVNDAYNITSTVNDVMNMAVAMIGDKGLELVVDCDARIPCGLVGDEQKIRRAVMNVVDNAIKFTREGGVRLTITTREETYGANLLVTVEDTGIGIEEEALEKLFTEFSQVDTRRDRRERGLGLGLVMARALASRMGGFLSISSVFGEGTTVQLSIPQAVADSRPIAALQRPEEIRVVLYINMSKFQYSMVRDSYDQCIRHIVQYLGINQRHCRSLAETRLRVEQDNATHVFVGWEEYCEDRAYFEELSLRRRVVLVLERGHKQSVEGSKLVVVYKPFCSLAIAAVLNGQYERYGLWNPGRAVRFTADGANVLVVDDNQMNLRVMEGLLRPYRVNVATAENGREALDKLGHGVFDLVFMDHMMPEMDGVETFHRLRQMPGTWHETVPVVALTANAVGGAREMFLAEGFSDYVAKPVELSALERVLQKFIPAEKLRRTSGGEPEGPAEAPLPAPDRPAMPAPEGIDVALGMGYCGDSLEDYLAVVRTFRQIGGDRLEKLRRDYDSGDWEDYTIQVHALKSTSLNVGAVKLSRLARDLEKAGKERDEGRLHARAGELLEEYRRVLDAIGADPVIFPKGGEEAEDAREDLETPELEKALKELGETLETLELDAVNACLEGLSGRRFRGKSVRELLRPVEERAARFDFEGAAQALKELLPSPGEQGGDGQ